MISPDRQSEGGVGQARPGKILLCFLASWLVSVIAIGIVSAGCIFVLLGKTSDEDTFVTIVASVVLLFSPFFALLVTDRLCRTQLSSLLVRPGAIKGIVIGSVAGTVLFCWIVTVSCVFQQVRILAYNGLFPSLLVATLMFGNAVTEETVFRGVLFNRVEKSQGTLRAAVVSTMIFGSLHFFSGGVDNIFTATAAGLLLCLVYIISRNLWIGIGIHWFWNFLTMETFSYPTPPVKGLFIVQVHPGFAYLDAVLQLFLAAVVYFLWRTASTGKDLHIS